MKPVTKTIQVATALIQNKKGEILLLKRNEKNYHGYWQFPEGKVDKNESFQRTLKRELQEELGSSPKIISKLGDFSLTFTLKGSLLHATRHVYKVDVPKKIVLSKEHSAFGWFTHEAVLKLKLTPGMKKILEML